MTLYLKDLLDPQKAAEFVKGAGPPRSAHKEGSSWEKGCRCEDCYYEAIGAEIEAHPIGGAGFRRG